MKNSLTFLICLLVSLIGYTQTLTPNSAGFFTFTPSGPLSNQPVNVHYYIPNGDITTMPIVFSFHGATRNGAAYRNYWISMASANNFMVFAPEFSETNYPGLGDNYLMGNLFDDGDNPSTATFNNQNEWTFSVIDPIFDSIVASVNGTQQYYNAWGHSGGAQFLHRFVLYMPNSKLDVAVCSNSGWYTVPENSVNFPYGILNGQLPNTDLIDAFSKKLIVHLGQDDDDPNSPGLRHNTVVDNQQGLHRYERGVYFFNTSQAEANAINTPFNWEKHDVVNVGHDAQPMANDALPFIMMSTLSTQQIEKENIIIYPNPVKDFVYIKGLNGTPKTIEIINLQGRLIKTIKNKAFSLTEAVDVSDLKSGIYLLKIEGQIFKIVKN